MKKTLCVAIVLALILALCGNAFAATTIRLSNNLSATDDLNVQFNTAAENIKTRTDGNIILEIYPGGTLLNYADAVEAIMSDAGIMYYCSIADWADYLPEQSILQCGFINKTTEVYEKLMETDFFKNLIAGCEKANLHCVQPGFVGGFRYIMANKEINTLDDLKGLKIRVPNVKSWMDMYNDLGANPVGMSSSETLQALQTGVIDGVDQSISQYYQGGYDEVCKVVNKIGGMLLADNVWCSANFWATIDPEYQAIITEEMKDARDRYSANTQALEDKYVAELVERGIDIHECPDITPFVEATRNNILEYDIGQELLDTIAGIEAELGL